MYQKKFPGKNGFDFQEKRVHMDHNYTLVILMIEYPERKLYSMKEI